MMTVEIRQKIRHDLDDEYAKSFVDRLDNLFDIVEGSIVNSYGGNCNSVDRVVMTRVIGIEKDLETAVIFKSVSSALGQIRKYIEKLVVNGCIINESSEGDEVLLRANCVDGEDVRNGYDVMAEFYVYRPGANPVSYKVYDATIGSEV